MARKPIVRDEFGELVNLSHLTEEVGGASATGVRQPMPEHPSWGLSPDGLAGILRDSEGTDPSRYYALLADIQEREWHYRGVLFQRRAALAQLPISVDPYSDRAEHVEQADFIRSIVTAPKFEHARFELADALDKGMGFGELLWDTSEKQWMPTDIKLRNPTWFRYSRVDLETPLLLDDQGQEQPLAAYKWVTHRARLNAGIPVRDGLGRAAVWAWMFKNYDIKSWSIFLARYGLPFRYATFPAGTKRAERSQLLNGLRMLGSDAAAIFPEGIDIKLEKGGDSSNGSAFKDQATYFDEQISKLVLGQTGTSDASKGGYAVGRVHEGVRDAIAAYDGLVLSMTLNRDLVRPAIQLNYGQQEGYPAIKIGLGDMRNVELVMKYLGELVDRGLQVEASQVYPMFGLTEPATGKNVVLLQPRKVSPTPPQPGEEPGGPSPSPAEVRADPSSGDGGAPNKRTARLSVEEPAVPAGKDAIEIAAKAAADPGQLAELRRAIEAAIEESTSYEEFLARLESLAKGPVDQAMVEKLAALLFNARLAGELGAPIRKTP